jgi:hypothetical protein
MTGGAIEATALSAMPSEPMACNHARSGDAGSFSAAMADVDVARALRVASVSPKPLSLSGLPQSNSVLGALARQLDEIGRHRLQAQTLAEQLAGEWSSGVDSPTLAVAMHRQARAMASYNASIMWGAKLVGVTAGALRQLVTAT